MSTSRVLPAVGTAASPHQMEQEDDSDRQATLAFLEKTFDMISECPEEIGGWNSDGTGFYIKEQAQFAGKNLSFTNHFPDKSDTLTAPNL